MKNIHIYNKSAILGSEQGKGPRWISLHNSQPGYQLKMPAAARLIFPMLLADLCVIIEL